MAPRSSRREPIYFTLLGVAIGTLIAGVLVPFASGTRASDQPSSFEGLAAEPLPAAQDAPAASPAPDGTTAPAQQQPGAATSTEPTTPTGQGADARTGTGSGSVSTTPPAPGDGSAPPESAPARQQSQSAPASTNGATDRGVTAEKIDLGIMVFDLAGASELGLAVPGADPEAQRRWWTAWVGDLNDRGGIHGRLVEPHYYRYDALSADSQRAACLRATQDDGVFAVIETGAIGQGTSLCFTQENQTPFLSLGSQGFSADDYERSGGLLFSMFPQGTRTMANFAWELHQLGELEEEAVGGQRQRRTIGIVSSEVPGARRTIDEGLVATLEQLGYEVAEWAELSQDTNTAASQVPVAVNQMRAAEVDAVLMLAGVFAATQFVQQAEGQAYFPSYYVTDWLVGWSETYVSNMPDSFDGTLITTSRTGERHAGFPRPPLAQECLDIHREQTGQELPSEEDSVEQWSALLTCQVFRLFELGALAAGPELTRARLSTSLQSLGEVPMAVFGGGSLAPGKFGAADLVRTARFDPQGCGCWLPADDFRPPRF